MPEPMSLIRMCKRTRRAHHPVAGGVETVKVVIKTVRWSGLSMSRLTACSRAAVPLGAMPGAWYYSELSALSLIPWSMRRIMAKSPNSMSKTAPTASIGFVQSRAA